MYTVDQNGCYLTLKVGKKAQSDNTATGVCPEKPAELTHPSCTIRLPGQTVSGVSYDAITENGKDAITVTVTAQNITTHFEAGICQLLGTSHATYLTGSVILAGFDTEGNPVDIRATGGED